MALNYIGTAGWSLPRATLNAFPQTGTHLQRYAGRFNCAEINSSFYRSHAEATYRRWADSTSPTFRFAVKVPRVITHDEKLRRARAPLRQFLDEIAGLRRKLGPLLLQLPPSLEFDVRVARRFFDTLRGLHSGAVVCEPRNKSWFEDRADRVLIEYGISRVASDPAVTPLAASPGGATRLRYYRLHGSPRMYWSNYTADQLRELARAASPSKGRNTTWYIFDNTASGCGTSNALELQQLL